MNIKSGQKGMLTAYKLC